MHGNLSLLVKVKSRISEGNPGSPRKIPFPALEKLFKATSRKFEFLKWFAMKKCCLACASWHAFDFFKHYEYDSVAVGKLKSITIISGFFKGVLALGTRFGSLEFIIGSIESEKIIIGSLESEKSGPWRSISIIGDLTFSLKKPWLFICGSE